MSNIHARLQAALADRYVLGRELGRGMATVYLAQDLKHDRSVALRTEAVRTSAVLGGVTLVAVVVTGELKRAS